MVEVVRPSLIPKALAPCSLVLLFFLRIRIDNYFSVCIYNVPSSDVSWRVMMVIHNLEGFMD